MYDFFDHKLATHVIIVAFLDLMLITFMIRRDLLDRKIIEQKMHCRELSNNNVDMQSWEDVIKPDFDTISRLR